MERNLEEMIRSLEEEKSKIETEMNSETDSKIVSEMKEDLKKVEEEIEKSNLIALEDKKREVEEALKSESDPKIIDEMKTDILKMEAEIQERSDKYGFKNTEDKEQARLSREDAFSKSRELQKALEVLENRKQEISNALGEEKDLKVIAEINNDLIKIEQEIKSKTNELNLLKSTYKISEVEIQEKLSESVRVPEPEPMGNSEEMSMEELFRSGILTEEEIKELLGTTSETEQKQESPKDSETLTKEEIEELLGAASETEQEQELSSEPEPEENSEDHDTKTEIESDLPPIPELKNWREEILREYLSKEEFDSMSEFQRQFYLNTIIFKESTETFSAGIDVKLSEEERKTQYEKYIKELTKETKIYNKNLREYSKKEKDRLSQLKKGIDDLEIELIHDAIKEIKEEIEGSSMNLKIAKLAVERDILFDEEEFQKLETAVRTGEIQLDSEQKPQQKPEKSEPEPMKAKNEYDWGELAEDQIDELWAEGIVPGSQEYKQAYDNFAPGILTYKPEVHDIEPEVELGSEQTEPEVELGSEQTETEEELGSEQTETEEELGSEETEQTPPQEEETKAHGNRLAKMLGTLGSWVANKAKVGGEKVAESDQKEDSNLPAPVKEGNFFTRIGKAIGNKVAQWQQEVIAEEENSAYYDEETYSEAKKKREEREEAKENRKAEKAKAKREKKNIEEELKSGVAENVNEILDRDSEHDTEKESEEQDRPNLVGYDTRDIGFIKKWMEGELRRPVHVDLANGRRAKLSPDGTMEEVKPWKEVEKENESVNAVNQKEGEPTEKVGDEEPKKVLDVEKHINDLFSDENAQEDTMTDKAETSNPWDVSDDVKKATEEAGRQAGEKKEVLVLKGDAVVTDKGNVICDLDEK